MRDLLDKLSAIAEAEEVVEAKCEDCGCDPCECATNEDALSESGKDCSCCGNKINAEGKCGCDESCEHCGGQHDLSEAAKPDYIDLDGDGDKEESMKKAAKDKKAKKESVKESEEVAEDDIATQIRQRYSDFMKSETAQGNDLDTINIAVKEATSSAMAIDDSFSKMFDMMGRLMKVTAEGAVLTKMVEREGGDSSWIADAHQKLIEAMEAIEQAHMYSNPKEED